MANIEEEEGRYYIHISNIPRIDKSAFINCIVQLVTDQVIEGVSNLRDESDRQGIRIILEIKKGFYPQKILDQLMSLLPS